MPFVRYSRDKRGYEQIWLVHAPAKKGRSTRPRVLYWYRSPPGVRVGREPFDPALRAQLEARYPDVRFDWEQLSAAAVIPPLEAEPWRERRRAQREARRSREADEREEDDRSPALPPAEQGTDQESPAQEAAVEGGESVPPAPAPTPRAAGRRRRRGGRGRGQARAEGADPTDRQTPSSDS